MLNGVTIVTHPDKEGECMNRELISKLGIVLRGSLSEKNGVLEIRRDNLRKYYV